MLVVIRDLTLIAAGVVALYALFRYLADGKKDKSLTEQLNELHAAAMADLSGKQIMSEIGIAAPDPIWIKDAKDDLSMYWVSDEYTRRFLTPQNKTRDDYIGQTDYAIWPKAIADEFRRNDKAILTGPAVIRAIERDHDGSFLYVVKSRHTTQAGGVYIRGQSASLKHIFGAIAGKLGQSQALELVRSAYDGRPDS